MPDLLRHRLVRLSHVGWKAVLGQPWTAEDERGVAHWAAHGLPLVVTQQPCRGDDSGCIWLGLPTPPDWGRRRIAIRAALSSVLSFDVFPSAIQITGLPSSCDRLLRRLSDLQAEPRVYGSYGWQQLTGLRYIHADSDLDLQLRVADAAAADRVADALATCKPPQLRIDGELTFPDGAAVAWREWQQWRAGLVDRVLVKRLRGVAMETGAAWLPEAQPC